MSVTVCDGSLLRCQSGSVGRVRRVDPDPDPDPIGSGSKTFDLSDPGLGPKIFNETGPGPKKMDPTGSICGSKFLPLYTPFSWCFTNLSDLN